MTIEEAKQEIPTFDSYVDEMCNACTFDGYCPTYAYCDVIRQSEKMFDKVQQAWARYDGDVRKVWRYVKQTIKG